MNLILYTKNSSKYFKMKTNRNLCRMHKLGKTNLVNNSMLYYRLHFKCNYYLRRIFFIIINL